MIKKLSIIIALFILLFTTPVSAKEVSYIKENINQDMKLCEYSDEYLEYLNLTEEERNKVNVPPICKVDEKSNLINNITSYSLNSNSDLPEYYSSVEEGYITAIKDQKSTNSCWAFTSIANLESYMLKRFNVTYDLSERHMEYGTAYYFMDNEVNEDTFYRNVGDGGNVFISSAYLTNENGPVLEVDMPFESNHALIYKDSMENKEKVIDVNDITIMRGNTCSDVSTSIKEHVMNYGSVQTSIYMTQSTSYYNSETAAFYYNGGTVSNHAVTIVGWDDNYSKENFAANNQPQNNGAWIVKNSYGFDFGQSGYFYISYEDYIVCSITGSITDADTEFNDNLYSYDKLGFNASGGTDSSNTGYAASTFTKSDAEEILKEVILGSPSYTDFEVYLIPTKVETISLDSATKILEGTITYGGYKTVKLEEEIVLSDTEFTILVKYTNTEGYAIPLSIKDSSIYYTVDIEDGKGFVSLDGIDFYDSKTFFGDTIAVPSIKASTDNKVDNTEIEEPDPPEIEEDQQTPSITINNNLDSYYYSNVKGGTYNLNLTTKNIEDNEMLNVKITYEEQDVTESFVINNKAVTSSNTDINIIVPENKLNAGIYTILISYNDISTSVSFKLLEQKNNEYLRIQANTLYSSLIKSKTTTNTKVIKVYDKNNTEISSGIITTGCILNIIDDTSISNYIIVVIGDVSGDGFIKSNDALLIKRSLVGLISLNEVEQKAADVSNDSRVASNDALLIKRYLVGIISNIGG